MAYMPKFDSPDVSDCNFLENVYAGIYSSHSWPYIRNCVFDGNYNNSFGLKADYSEITVEDCIIRRQSDTYYGSNCFAAGSYITLNRCKIQDNKGSGIYCSDSYLETTGCTIRGNGNDGIHAMGQYAVSYPTIADNIINDNTHCGIYTDTCEHIVIKNNWIYHNGINGTDSGLNLQNSIFPPYIRNNTIVKNAPYGIYVYYGADPCLINDIVYNNGSEPSKNVDSARGISSIFASYCCIGGGFAGIDNNNISCDPCFRNPDANDYHLRDDSNCIDAGDPCADYTDETDIDGRPRVIYGKPDIVAHPNGISGRITAWTG